MASQRSRRARTVSNPSDRSITEVARRANVSIGTVSRVINQAPNVNGDLRRRVWVASREVGFIPKLHHRCIALVTGRRSPGLPIGYVSILISLISQYLAEERYSVELIDVENLDLVYKGNIEGAIGVVFDERLAELKEIPNLPLLTINKPMAEVGIHGVRTDHHQQAALATKHLIERGHRRIGFLAIQGDEWGSRERLRGYRETLAAHGIAEDPTLVQFTIAQPIYDILNRWTTRGGVSAILNFSEDASLEVLHILSNVLKLRIGQDVSTISLEDLPIYQYFSPPQTTVSQPLAELANLAVEKMIALCALERDDREKQDVIDVSLPTSLIERDSVATIASI